MGWGTSLIREDYFSKQTFRTIDDIESEINDATRENTLAINTLNRLATMTEPQKFINPEKYDCADVYTAIESMVSEAIETLQENAVYLYRLQAFKNDWDDCHTTNKDGRIVAKEPPPGFEPPYMYGDFIEGDRHDEHGDEVDQDV